MSWLGRPAVSKHFGFTIWAPSLSISWGPGLPAGPGEAIDASSTLRWEVSATTSAPVTLLLFASQPGAWVDLSADLAWLTGCPPHQLILDGDLSATVSLDHGDLTGASIINQAVGALIGLGHLEATSELASRARAAHTDLVTAARTLLDSLAPTPAVATE